MNTVKNFVESDVEADQLSVSSSAARANLPALVSLICMGGSTRFQHSMTPNQARQLANYLQAEANMCEQENKVLEAA